MGLVHELLELVHLFAEGLVGDGLGGVAFCYDGCGGEEGEEDGGELHFDGLGGLIWMEKKIDSLLNLEIENRVRNKHGPAEDLLNS